MENKRYIVYTLHSTLTLDESEIFNNLQEAINYQNSIISESFFEILHAVARVWIEEVQTFRGPPNQRAQIQADFRPAQAVRRQGPGPRPTLLDSRPLCVQNNIQILVLIPAEPYRNFGKFRPEYFPLHYPAINSRCKIKKRVKTLRSHSPQDKIQA